MSTKKAITYYKLESNYEGDITKYCSLAGTEIDANFYFLRGNDIADAEWDATTKNLKLIRVNGEVIEVPFKCCCCDMCGTSLTGSTTPICSSTATSICDCCVDDIYYDKATATLHYVSKGIDRAIEGFYSSKDFRTDYTLEGDGSDADPLRISSVMDSGTLAPAIGYIDLADTAEKKETLPATPEYGDRYVTHEWVSPYGMLFNFAAVEAINEILSKSNDGWRVPTKEDWDSMLNGVELCDEDRNHRSLKSSPYLGKWAGAYLKSLDADWAEETIAALKEHEIWRSYGFDILPAGDYYEGRNHSFGKIGAYWTSTMCEDGDVWIKKFHGNKNTIQQRAAETDLFMSIRLVKDLEKGYHETEVIEGVPYNTVIMPSLDEKGNLTHKVWTVQNVSMSTIMEGDTRYPKAKAKPVLRDIECTDGTTGTPAPGEYKYFINEWESEEWVKREITEGMSLILKTGVDGSADEEWIINNGKLIKNAELLYSKVKDYVDETVEAEASARTAADEALMEAINEETSARTEADEYLMGVICEEISARTEADAYLWEAINEEISARTEADAILQEEIDVEVERSKGIDEDLANAIGADGDVESGYSIDLRDYEYEQLDSDVDADLINEIEALLKAEDSSVKEVSSENELEDAKKSEKYKYIVFNNNEKWQREYYERLSSPYIYIANTGNPLEDNLVDAVKNLDIAIQEEAILRESGDTLLEGAINEEISARTEADAILQEEIDVEVERSKGIDEDLANAIGANGDVESGYSIDLRDYYYRHLKKDVDGDLINEIEALSDAEDSSVKEVYSENELEEAEESKEYKYIVFHDHSATDSAELGTDSAEWGHEFYERISPYQYIANTGEPLEDNLVDAVKNLDIAIQEEAILRESGDTLLEEAIIAETANRIAEDERLANEFQEAIDKEASDRDNADKVLQKEIKDEASTRDEYDAYLLGEIEKATAYTETEVARLDKRIDDEEDTREANDIKTVEEPLVINTENDAVIVNNNGATVVTITVDFDFGEF